MAAPSMTMVQLASLWRDARRMYPLYAALISMFEIGMEPCRDLESPINRSEPAVMERIQDWYEQVDNKIEVWQLRQLLQTSALSSDENLRALIHRHLNIKDKTQTVRDKVDYLVVQYYAHVSPQDSHNTTITPEHVMEVLFPVLGYKETLVLPVHQEIEVLLAELNQCKSLGEMFHAGILNRSRSLKERAGSHYFDPAMLILFARCNFLIRLGFFRSMHAELHAIRQGLHDLQLKKIDVVDCQSVGLGASETLSRIRELCHAWKEPFRAAYSLGDPFKQIVGLRKIVEDVLVEANKKLEQIAPTEVESPTSIQEMQKPSIQPIDSHSESSEPSIPEEIIIIHSTQTINKPGIISVEATQENVIGETQKQITADATPVTVKPTSSPSVPVPTKLPVHKRTQVIDMSAMRRTTNPDQPIGQEIKTEAVDTGMPEVSSTTKPVDDGSADLDGCLKMIFNKIRSVTAPGMTVMMVDITGTRITLASWEVAAFARGIDDVSAALRRCVGVRALLCVMLDRLKGGSPADLPTTLALCHSEAALVQEKVAKAKDINNIDAAVNLAATAKRLLSTVEEAEKFLAKK